MTGAAYGMMFMLIARTIPARLLIPAGAVYGLAVFAISSLVGLPIAAAITGSGDTISQMARVVGWATFAVEHMLFGVSLATFVLLTTRSQAVDARVVPAARRNLAA